QGIVSLIGLSWTIWNVLVFWEAISDQGAASLHPQLRPDPSSRRVRVEHQSKQGSRGCRCGWLKGDS
ncbi:MAG: hypothetical protein KAQ78_01890, partial [Candidatus Latescibacteria bacterium]|nr:hypothetical protein [Candidatus Latescibacterota bacterium]